MTQAKQVEWFEQWKIFDDDELFLFNDWIFPYILDDFSGKTVLECGCGGGQHTSFIAPFAKNVTSVDLNTIPIARKRNKGNNNVTFYEADIATMDLGTTFDFVISIGVVHHTDDPDKTIANLKRHIKPGGNLILWVYSEEGNMLMKHTVEPFRKSILLNVNRKTLLQLARFITAIMYLPIYTVYLLPLKILPYYHYFVNFRKLSFYRNVLNIFDKLNAPQVMFITQNHARSWLQNNEFDKIHISSYNNVSWRISGEKC